MSEATQKQPTTDTIYRQVEFDLLKTTHHAIKASRHAIYGPPRVPCAKCFGQYGLPPPLTPGTCRNCRSPVTMDILIWTTSPDFSACTHLPLWVCYCTT